MSFASASTRLGLLGYLETKNIGRKRERADAFATMGDSTSRTDMEFDWVDETLHTEYGRRWLRRLLELRGEDPESWPAVLARCEQLVRDRVARATPRISSGSGRAPTHSSRTPDASGAGNN